MSLKLNNKENRLLIGNVPVSTVLMGDNVVYGESFKIVDFSYPAVPKGVKGYTVYANDVPVLTSPNKAGTIKVGLYDYIKVKVERADNYQNIRDVRLYCGEEEYRGFEELDTEEYVSTGSQKKRKVVFSVMSKVVKAVKTSVRLEITAGAPCSVQYVTIPIKTGITSVSYEFVPSPWTKRNAEAIQGEITFTSNFGVVEGASVRLISIKRDEGFIVTSSYAYVNGSSYSSKQGIIVGDYPVEYRYDIDEGRKSIVKFPAAPEGVVYSIARTSSTYSLHPSLDILEESESVEAGVYGNDPRRLALYEGDKIVVSTTRLHGYTYAEFGLNGGVTENGNGTFILNADANEITVEQIPEKGTGVPFHNPDEDFGYSKFIVESRYFNESVVDSHIGAGDFELFVGDKIISDGERKIGSETMRVTKDMAYRTPSVGLKKADGTVIVAPTRQYVSYVLDSDGIEAVYTKGALKSSNREMETVKFQSKGNYSEFIPFVLIDGALEKANVTSVLIGYYVKRYLGDGIITQFPYKTVTVKANESFSQDWERTGGLLPPDSASGVLEGNFKVDTTTCTLHITSYDVNYVSNISSKGCRYTPLYLI